MNNNKKYFLNLLSAAIKNQPPPKMLADDIDWKEIYTLAQNHQVHTLISPVLDRIDQDEMPPMDLKQEWQHASLLSAAYQMEQIEGFKGILVEFNRRNIPVVLLKGIVTRELYPFPELCKMGDIDILVKTEDLPACVSALKQFGYSEMSYDCSVIACSHLYLPRIEIHDCILSPQRAINFRFMEELVRSNIEISIFYGTEVHLLSPTFNLAYIVSHMYLHYFCRGVGVRQLCDIALFIYKYEKKINWNCFWDMIQKADIEAFTAYVFMACGEYLDICIRKASPHSELKEIRGNLGIFINELIMGGVYGRNNIEKGVENSLLRYKKFVKDFKLNLILNFFSQIVFPRSDILSEKYDYAKKNPRLLPAAWIQRIIHVVFYKTGHVKQYIRSLFILTFSSKRIAYLKSVGLIK